MDSPLCTVMAVYSCIGHACYCSHQILSPGVCGQIGQAQADNSVVYHSSVVACIIVKEMLKRVPCGYLKPEQAHKFGSMTHNVLFCPSKFFFKPPLNRIKI